MLPGPLMMGIAFDNTCVLWQTLPCSEASGSCAFYDNAALSKNFTILMVTVKFISFAAMLLAVALYRPPLIRTITRTPIDDDDDKEVGCTDGSQQTAAMDFHVDGERELEGKTDFNGTSAVWRVQTDANTMENNSVNEGFVFDDGGGTAFEASHL